MKVWNVQSAGLHLPATDAVVVARCCFWWRMPLWPTFPLFLPTMMPLFSCCDSLLFASGCSCCCCCCICVGRNGWTAAAVAAISERELLQRWSHAVHHIFECCIRMGLRFVLFVALAQIHILSYTSYKSYPCALLAICGKCPRGMCVRMLDIYSVSDCLLMANSEYETISNPRE